MVIEYNPYKVGWYLRSNNYDTSPTIMLEVMVELAPIDLGTNELKGYVTKAHHMSRVLVNDW
jgi:hypothetical protein